MEKLAALYTAREEALRAWDATEYNRIDAQIRAILAAARAEVNLGLREPEILSFPV